MKRTSGIFDEITISLIEAGEESGNLDDILGRLADELEKKKKLNDKIKSAFTYPIIMAVVVVGVVILMITVLVPTIEDVYSTFGADELPGVTRFVVAISNWTFSYWWLIIIMTAIFGIGIKLYLDTDKGKLFFGKLMITIPLFGNLIVNMQLAQFTRILALLMSSGLSIIQALELTASSLSNIIFRKTLLESVKEVEKGVSLSVPLSRSEVFPLIVSQMVSVGEETGSLDKILSKMADFYESEVEYITGNLSTLLEPVILIVMGGVIGLIAAAVYVPMFNLAGALGA